MKDKMVLPAMIGFFIVLMLTLQKPVAAVEGEYLYSREQLTQMLAPVALYPDALLSQVLIASTYPLEVVAADRWVRRNPLLTGVNLDQALLDQDWDVSVKALCHVPTVLALMSERLDETTNLGNAFLAQEGEVMEVIQDLRSRAYREGNLQSNDKQKVVILANGIIVIEPADPQTIYVPYYDTRYVYGPWWYPAWPPWYWGPGRVVVGSSIYFWPDVYFGFGIGFGYWSYFDWPQRTIIITVNRRPRFIRQDYDWISRQGGWRHDPRHRRGVGYRDRPTAVKYGQFRERSREFNREVRGFADRDRTRRDDGVRRPGWQGGTRDSQVGTTPGTRTQTRSERGGSTVSRPAERERAPVVRPAPSRSAPPAVERGTPGQQLRRETVRQRETSRERERTTIFSGGDNGRQESRSSIRGRSSRESMSSSGSGRDSAPVQERGEDRGGRGGFRR
jgi:hypothetical protein